MTYDDVQTLFRPKYTYEMLDDVIEDTYTENRLAESCVGWYNYGDRHNYRGRGLGWANFGVRVHHDIRGNYGNNYEGRNHNNKGF